MTKTSFKEKAAFSMLWTVLQKFASIGITFVSGIILARLLTPSDFGTIGLLAIFMLVSDVFIDGGFGSALIQKQRPTQTDYSTIFWWNLFMAIILYVILYVSAPYIAEFYRNDVLCPILRVEALSLIIGSFNTIQINQLKKNFNFKSLAFVTLSSSTVSLLITIILAYLGFGVWSLVIQSLINRLFQTVFYWFKSPWRPSFEFSIISFKQLASFGVFVFLTKVINEICNNIQGLLIGSFFNAADMGYYTKAKNTEKVASTSISSSLNQVTYPIYAELQDDIPAMINMIKKITLVIAFITFPIMYILVLDAAEIITFLYSDKWIESVPYFQILCFAGAAQCLQTANLQPINAIGKSKTTFIWNLLKRLLGVSMIVGGFFVYGMKGLMIGMVCNSWMLYFVNAILLSKYIGYKLKSQLKSILPILVLSIVALLVTLYISKFLSFHFYLNGVIKFVIFVLLYYVGVNFFAVELKESIKSMLLIILSKFKKV